MSHIKKILFISITIKIYFYTLQCCAVSFIENLTYESLNMPEDEFNQFMSGKIMSSGTWESALIMCEVTILSDKINKC